MKARQLCKDVLGDAVRRNTPAPGRRSCSERQYGDGRLVGQRQCRCRRVGVVGSASTALEAGAAIAFQSAASHSTRKARTGLSIFFRDSSPSSWNFAFSRPRPLHIRRTRPRSHPAALLPPAARLRSRHRHKDRRHRRSGRRDAGRSEDDGGVRGLILVGFGHCLLELDGGAKGINGAGEL